MTSPRNDTESSSTNRDRHLRRTRLSDPQSGHHVQRCQIKFLRYHINNFHYALTGGDEPFTPDLTRSVDPTAFRPLPAPCPPFPSWHFARTTTLCAAAQSASSRGTHTPTAQSCQATMGLRCHHRPRRTLAIVRLPCAGASALPHLPRHRRQRRQDPGLRNPARVSPVARIAQPLPPHHRHRLPDPHRLEDRHDRDRE